MDPLCIVQCDETVLTVVFAISAFITLMVLVDLALRTAKVRYWESIKSFFKTVVDGSKEQESDKNEP